ncbi:hypothetical protein PENSPDRAFT_732460 [Peniophora sp. CONT]|nr:hypothetical protein PENSPDRAFT_732460 [Peniophora sp. CONT]
MAGVPSMQVGRAHGAGVFREVWAALGWATITSIPSELWVTDSEFGAHTIALQPLSISSNRNVDALRTPLRAALRGVGLYLALSVILGIAPECFRPSFVYYVLTRDPQSAVADSFLSVADPAMARRLGTWPPRTLTLPDGSEVFDLAFGRNSDPENLLMAHPVLGLTQLSSFCTMSADDIPRVRTDLATHLAFGPHADTLDQQAFIAAIIEGADMARIEGGISPAQLVDNLTSAALTMDDEPEEPLTLNAIITDLFAGRTVVRSAQVIGRLRVAHEGSGRPDAEECWMNHLKRYLRGGLGVERALAFLRAMTGSTFLFSDPPLNRLTVHFVSTLPRSEMGVVTAAHTCFGEADILMNDAIEEMVSQDVVEDLSIPTDFDVYMDVFCAASGNGDLNMA